MLPTLPLRLSVSIYVLQSLTLANEDGAVSYPGSSGVGRMQFGLCFLLLSKPVCGGSL